MYDFRAKLQHRMNPLHIYCRLRDLGISVPTAQRVTGFYERFVYRLALC